MALIQINNPSTSILEWVRSFIELKDLIGDLSLLEIPASSLVDAINARKEFGDLSALTTTDKTSLVNAINEVFTKLGEEYPKIGILANLDTTVLNNLVGALNSLDSENDLILQNINTHISTVTGNPHSVTKAQIGLGNVDDTSDLSKPVSLALQTLLNSKLDSNSNSINYGRFRQANELEISASMDLIGICWSSGKRIFCAVSNIITAQPQVATSSDGIHWTYRNSSELSPWSGVVWGNTLNLFCAVSTAGKIMTSPDGTTWTSRTAGSVATFRAIAYSQSLNRFCAVASAGTNRIQHSNNGTSWSNVVAPVATWKDICWSPGLGLWCAVADTGTNRVMISSNTTSWNSYLVPDATWKSVCWSPELGIFCAVASSGADRVMISSNGINWIGGSDIDNSVGWIGIAWSPEFRLFYILHDNTHNYECVSSDGLHWIKISAFAAGLYANKLTYSSELKRFCGTYSAILEPTRFPKIITTT